jgi:hypothetical protein
MPANFGWSPVTFGAPETISTSMRTLLLTALVGIFALAASAADVTGKWVGQVPGRGGNMQDVTFNLKSSGDTVTGTMSTMRGDQQISEGKSAGNDISFVVTLNFNGNEIKQEYKGTVSGNEIKFTRSGGRGGPVEFTAKKQ